MPLLLPHAVGSRQLRRWQRACEGGRSFCPWLGLGRPPSSYPSPVHPPLPMQALSIREGPSPDGALVSLTAVAAVPTQLF